MSVWSQSPPRKRPVLAALATIPGREAALSGTLASLRPQVDELRVVCHDVTEPPTCVRTLANAWICEPDTRGANAKLHWANAWDGIYFACDDDTRYPPDYAERMVGWLMRWKHRALVTGHGRILMQRAKRFTDVKAAWAPRQANPGAWINYPGANALCFDTRLGVPARIPGKNDEEPRIARWAQDHRVPIWLAPHSADWLQWLLEGPSAEYTIWREEKAAGFALRNAVIRQQRTWRVFHA